MPTDSSSPSEHVYDELTPTKFSKHFRIRRLLLLQIILVIITIIIILGAIGIAVAITTKSYDTEDTSPQLVIDANNIIKELVHPNKLCSEKNNATTCHYADDVFQEDCSAVKCILYYDGIRIGDDLVVKRDFTTATVYLEDVNTDGVPCAPAKMCFTKHCLQITNLNLLNELQIVQQVQKASKKVIVDYANAQCFRTNMNEDHLEAFKNQTMNDACNTLTQTAVKLKIISCVPPKMAVYKDCIEEKHALPLIYEEIGTCPEEEIESGSVLPSTNKSVCNVRRKSGSVDVITEPYKCKKAKFSGYCFYGRCVPVTNSTKEN